MRQSNHVFSKVDLEVRERDLVIGKSYTEKMSDGWHSLSSSFGRHWGIG